jgi:hypothetical protein
MSLSIAVRKAVYQFRSTMSRVDSGLGLERRFGAWRGEAIGSKAAVEGSENGHFLGGNCCSVGRAMKTTVWKT